MAITKETELFKIDTNPAQGFISVRVDTVIKEDGVELSRSPHRHALAPFLSNRDAAGNWTHTPTDLSGEHASVQAIAATLWTDQVKEDFKTNVEQNAPHIHPVEE